MSAKKPPLSWRTKRRFWSRWQTFRMKVSKPPKITAPEANDKKIGTLPMQEKYPKIPVKIPVFDTVPKDESKLTTKTFVGAQLFINRLFPAMTLGPGTLGGSITSDNISPMHLLNIKRLAFETEPIHPSGTAPVHAASPMKKKPAPTSSWMEEIEINR